MAVVMAMTKWGRVGVVFATEEKSLKRPHEVTFTLSAEVQCCTTTIGKIKKGNLGRCAMIISGILDG